MDPSSGQTYYANQSTGESSWDPPPMTPAPVAANSYSAQPSAQPAHAIHETPSFNATNGSSTSQKVASKYGDGFVTSASNPQLAEQYGNVGTR
jgi:protein transport protein SEC31